MANVTRAIFYRNVNDFLSRLFASIAFGRIPYRPSREEDFYWLITLRRHFTFLNGEEYYRWNDGDGEWSFLRVRFWLCNLFRCAGLRLFSGGALTLGCVWRFFGALFPLRSPLFRAFTGGWRRRSVGGGSNVVK